jgi:hypothetical protein
VSKRSGKWKTKQLKGWVIKIYCHFQSMAHSILKTKKQCQQSQYVNQSESFSSSFSDLSGSKCCLQRKYMCRQHETLDCRKLHKQLSNSCVTKWWRTCVTTEWYHSWWWLNKVETLNKKCCLYSELPLLCISWKCSVVPAINEWYPFVSFLARGGYLFFNWYLRLGKMFFDFLMVGSATFLSRKIFVFGATARHK